MVGETLRPGLQKYEEITKQTKNYIKVHTDKINLVLKFFFDFLG